MHENRASYFGDIMRVDKKTNSFLSLVEMLVRSKDQGCMALHVGVSFAQMENKIKLTVDVFARMLHGPLGLFTPRLEIALVVTWQGTTTSICNFLDHVTFLGQGIEHFDLEAASPVDHKKLRAAPCVQPLEAVAELILYDCVIGRAHKNSPGLITYLIVEIYPCRCY